MNPFPARLHVLLAREAPTAVVIRRGPAKVSCSIGWDRERDEFTVGQWLRGRIYEKRCDISPDGQYWIYFAADYRRGRPQSTWTAVARAPYLKAVEFWPWLTHGWNGGGLFTGGETYLINAAFAGRERTGHSTGEVRCEGELGLGLGECPPIYHRRLARDGWVCAGEHEMPSNNAWFDKPLAAGWTLRKVAHSQTGQPEGKSCHWDEHQLLHTATDRRLERPDWEWADWDRHRLLWAAGGCLWTGQLGDEGLRDETMLHDFNGMTFEPLQAPY